MADSAVVVTSDGENPPVTVNALTKGTPSEVFRTSSSGGDVTLAPGSNRHQSPADTNTLNSPSTANNTANMNSCSASSTSSNVSQGFEGSPLPSNITNSSVSSAGAPPPTNSSSNTNLNLNPNGSTSSTNLNSQPQSVKKTSFQITSVTVDSSASNDGGDESGEEIDESHTEDSDVHTGKAFDS